MGLLHEATTLEALLAAAHRAATGKRQQPDVARFLMDAEPECLRLQRELRLPMDHPAAWQPSPVWQLSIRDPKPRMITVAPFRDRVVHQALCEVIVPELERSAIQHSYACRTGKGQHRALRQAQRFARRRPWVYKGDIRAYFASVPHALVMRSLRRRVGDSAICDRIERALQVPAPDCRGRWRLEPGDPGRLLEERPAQRARGEPQQEHPGQPQRQRRLSSRELNTRAAASAVVLASGPDGLGSWTPPLRPGVDQTPVPCPAASGGGTEAPAAGSGAPRVAAGPLQRGSM